MNTATTIHLGARDAIRVEVAGVVIESEDGSWVTLRPEDATTALRLAAVASKVHERMVAEKRERVALLERVEAA